MSMAVHTLLLSVSVLPFAERALKYDGRCVSNVLWTISFCMVFLLIVFILDPWTPRESTSVLVDVLVAVLFAYAMYLIYNKSEDDGWFAFVEITAISLAIVMIKQVGIGFLMVITFYGIVITSIRGFSNRKKFRKIIKYLTAFIFPIKDGGEQNA
jgi:hypothetical protein